MVSILNYTIQYMIQVSTKLTLYIVLAGRFYAIVLVLLDKFPPQTRKICFTEI